MKASKLVLFSVLIGFANAANATDIVAPANVVERKSCEDIAMEINDLMAITTPDTATQNRINQLKQLQRSWCQKRAGTRATHTIAATRTPIQNSAPTESPDTATEPDSTCETPDEYGCCPGEKYTDMGELGFNCCPETGGNCFLPIKSTNTEPVNGTETTTPELTDEQRIENINAGLCADGTKPNKFGCCGDEIFKDLGNTIFACCPKSGGDCFPPIK